MKEVRLIGWKYSMMSEASGTGRGIRYKINGTKNTEKSKELGPRPRSQRMAEKMWYLWRSPHFQSRQRKYMEGTGEAEIFHGRFRIKKRMSKPEVHGM